MRPQALSGLLLSESACRLAESALEQLPIRSRAPGFIQACDLLCRNSIPQKSFVYKSVLNLPLYTVLLKLPGLIPFPQEAL